MKVHKRGGRFSRMIDRVRGKAKNHPLRSLSKQKTSNAGRRLLKIGRTRLRPNRRKATIKFRLKDRSTNPHSNLRRATAKSVKKARIVRGTRTVRIMGQGQFTVGNKTLKELGRIDNSIVELVSSDRSDDAEFKKRLAQLTDIVKTTGKSLNPKDIIQSDIILPSVDLSVDDAKKLFKGEGVIPII